MDACAAGVFTRLRVVVRCTAVLCALFLFVSDFLRNSPNMVEVLENCRRPKSWLEVKARAQSRFSWFALEQ